MFCKKLKCVWQHPQNLALLPSCAWFTIRSRGVRAPSAKPRYSRDKEFLFLRLRCHVFTFDIHAVDLDFVQIDADIVSAPTFSAGTAAILPEGKWQIWGEGAAS